MQTIKISIGNVLQILSIFIGFWLVYVVKDVLIIVFLSWVISIAFNPLVDRIEENFSISRSITSALLILLVFGLVGGFVSFTIPQVISQISSLTNSLPRLITEAVNTLDNQRLVGQESLNQLQNQVASSVVGQIGQFSSSAVVIAGFFINSVTTILISTFLTYYFIVDKNVFLRLIKTLSNDSPFYSELYNRIADKLRTWLRGQFIAMIAIGVVTYLALIVLGVEFALPLAVLAGLLEIIPFIGPTVAAIPAVLIGVADSPTKAVIILVTYFAIQQLEASILIPRIMNQTVGLNPIAVIIAVMIGSRLLGPVGALISIPMTAIILIGIDEWKLHQKKPSES